MSTNIKDVEEAYSYFLDPGIYFDFMFMLCEPNYHELRKVCGHPIFLWDLFAFLCVDSTLHTRHSLEITNGWLERSYDKEEHESIKNGLASLGGYDDWEVLYNVFVMPLEEFICKEQNVSESLN